LWGRGYSEWLDLPTEFNKNLLTGSKVDRGAKSKAISQAYFFPSGREVG